MLSESFFVSFMWLVLCQSSSLWASLFIIPLSVFLVFLLGNFYLCLVFYLYTMVFISGLLIFLVVVASLVVQDQGSMIVFPFSFLVIFLGLYYSHFDFFWLSESQIGFVLWTNFEGLILIILLIFLVVVLSVISNFFLIVKGLTRSL